ncbi:hypothetical protein [Reichenbachiella versicolor]|uniref:hypothetical protein n=1 Tax=Reichenbachiella versicolor TaxID=1821036 RepID=UPI0013A54D24|nr:hypothetical protein [Reichenbachiella versicolor]
MLRIIIHGTFFGLLVLSFSTNAQMVGAEAMRFKNFTLHNAPPKYLLSKKSAVFISTPPDSKDHRLREDWKEFAKEIHGSFKKMGIDAVAYYYIDDLFSNSDVNESLAKDLIKRQFKYVILVEHTRSSINPDLENYYVITVTPFNKELTFVDEGANAWRIEGPSLNTLLVKMSKDIQRKEMKFSNYLIPDEPEFFTDAAIIKGRRIPTYAMDLKVEPLIVPKFQKYIPKDSSQINVTTRAKIKKFNDEIDRKNQRLEQIMSTYPLKYEISDNFSDSEVYNRGGQFVLLHFNTTGDHIKAFMDYEIDGDEILESKTAMGKVSLPAEAEVTKFYVKHVFTKDVYTGLNWDAALTWEEALENFVFNMKDILDIN